MMSLDRGDQCQGVVFRLPGNNLKGQLHKLVRREITVKPPNNNPRRVMVETEQGPLRAIAFVINRQSRLYTGRLAPEQVADVLPRACGHWGSCAEYLHNTVAHLEDQGIRDRNLLRLQALVAGRIKPDASDPAKRTALEHRGFPRMPHFSMMGAGSGKHILRLSGTTSGFAR